MKTERGFNSNFAIWFEGDFREVRRTRGSNTATDARGDVFVPYPDGSWHRFDEYLAPNLKLRRQPRDTINLGKGERPFGVDYGVRDDDPNKDFVHEIFVDENTGNAYTFRVLTEGEFLKLVKVNDYNPPKLLSPVDPFRFKSSIKGGKIKGR